MGEVWYLRSRSYCKLHICSNPMWKASIEASIPNEIHHTFPTSPHQQIQLFIYVHMFFGYASAWRFAVVSVLFFFFLLFWGGWASSSLTMIRRHRWGHIIKGIVIHIWSRIQFIHKQKEDNDCARYVGGSWRDLQRAESGSLWKKNELVTRCACPDPRKGSIWYYQKLSPFDDSGLLRKIRKSARCSFFFFFFNSFPDFLNSTIYYIS